MSELPDSCKLQFRLGVEQFNAGRFFDCHETLEKVWLEYLEPDRELIQGIIQIAVAYYHLGKGNPEGTFKLLQRGSARVKKYVPNYFGLELADFLESVEADLEQVSSDRNTPAEMFQIPAIRFI